MKSFPLFLLCAVSAAPQTPLTYAKTPGFYADSHDAKTPQQLVDSINGMFCNPTKDSEFRPLYAEKEVVNEAYRIYGSKEPSYQVCKDDISEAIFSWPIDCMKETIEPGKFPVFTGKSRVEVSKRGCMYTMVRCLKPDVFKRTSSELIKDVEEEMKDRRPGAGFWYQRKVYAPAKIVNEAYREWVGEEKAEKDGDVCKKHTKDGEALMGVVWAVFPDKNCQNAKVSYGNKCRDIQVECL